MAKINPYAKLHYSIANVGSQAPCPLTNTPQRTTLTYHYMRVCVCNKKKMHIHVKFYKKWIYVAQNFGGMIYCIYEAI